MKTISSSEQVYALDNDVQRFISEVSPWILEPWDAEEIGHVFGLNDENKLKADILPVFGNRRLNDVTGKPNTKEFLSQKLMSLDATWQWWHQCIAKDTDVFQLNYQEMLFAYADKSL